ncbi:MAG: conjugal transfer protein TraH, partial [Mesorhizobium sp.]
IIAWQTGYFEGTAVFRTPDPGEVQVDAAADQEPVKNEAGTSEESSDEGQSDAAEDPARDGDPDKAGIRIDLSGIGAK